VPDLSRERGGVNVIAAPVAAREFVEQCAAVTGAARLRVGVLTPASNGIAQFVGGFGGDMKILIDVDGPAEFVLWAAVVRTLDGRVINRFTCQLPGLPAGSHAIGTLREILGRPSEEQIAAKGKWRETASTS